MKKTLFPAVLACVLAAGSAFAQTNVSVRTGQTPAPIVPVVPFSAPGGASLVAPLSGLGLTPSMSVSLAPSIAPAAAHAALAAPAVRAALSVSAAPAASIAAVKAVAAAPAAAALPLGHAATPALSVLSSAASKDEKNDAAREARDASMFDGSVARASDVSAVAAPLAKPSRSLLGRAALAAGIWIAHPGIALAATAPAASAVEPGALMLMGSYAPLATAIAAVLGALFGLWSSRSKDGSPANIGHVFSSALSSGAIAGAAAFTLLDLTKVAFLGSSAAALTPLTAAVATAALAQAAFAAKFMDPATTPADRVMGAFPAVAMAFGLSVGAIAFLPAATMLSISTAALMLTGAATALYTALFRLEKSPAAGPAAMGRGFVLQALMTGLALALGPSPYALFFFALGAWGFGLVMLATAKEAWAAVPDSFKTKS